MTAAIIEHIDHFQRRVLQDALVTGSAAYWRRRAETFEWARPRPGDYVGQASRDELAARDARCRDMAEACRRRAAAAWLDRERVAEEVNAAWDDAAA